MFTNHGAEYGKQIAFGDNEDLYIRQLTGNNYQSWRKLYHDGNSNNLSTNWNAQIITASNNLYLGKYLQV